MLNEISQNIFGLDISDHVIRLVKLNKKRKKLVLKSYNEIKVPPKIIEQGYIQQPDKLALLIKQLIKTSRGRSIKTNDVIAVLPETKTFIKVIDLVPKEGVKLTKLIREEIENHIPLNPSEIYIDWQIISRNKNSIKILIGVAPKDLVDSYLDLMEKAGLNTYVLEIEAAAIVRSIMPKKTDGAKIIIDFGANRTGLIIYDNNACQFTVSLPISGKQISETIAQTLKVDYKTAEKFKTVCGLDPTKCKGVILKLLYQQLDDLTKEIKKAAEFYQNNFTGANQIKEIILVGGGANLTFIDKVLTEKLNISSTIGNPLLYITQSKKMMLPQSKVLSFTTAIGLALRAFEKKDII